MPRTYRATFEWHIQDLQAQHGQSNLLHPYQEWQKLHKDLKYEEVCLKAIRIFLVWLPRNMGGAIVKYML